MKKYCAILLMAVCGFLTGALMHSRLEAKLSQPEFSTEVIMEDFVEVPAPKLITASGLASWYSQKDPGIRKHTANREVFRDSALTCAMWNVPFNQQIRVTNLHNGKSVVVRVNDRGPHRRFVKQGRIIDLSKAAFSRIGDTRHGLIKVQLEFLPASTPEPSQDKVALSTRSISHK